MAKRVEKGQRCKVDEEKGREDEFILGLKKLHVCEYPIYLCLSWTRVERSHDGTKNSEGLMNKKL